jgi:hypothetical protein
MTDFDFRDNCPDCLSLRKLYRCLDGCPLQVHVVTCLDCKTVYATRMSKDETDEAVRKAPKGIMK